MSLNLRDKHILVIGGLGYRAGNYALNALTEQLLSMTFDEAKMPKLTYRTVHGDDVDFEGNGCSSQSVMLSVNSLIHHFQPDAVLFACNTMFSDLDAFANMEASYDKALQWMKHINIEVCHKVNECIRSMVEYDDELSSLVLMTSPAARANKLYRSALSPSVRRELQIVEPSMNMIEDTIRSAAILNENTTLKHFVIPATGAIYLIGCTELSMLKKTLLSDSTYHDTESTVIDTLDLMIDCVFEQLGVKVDE